MIEFSDLTNRINFSKNTFIDYIISRLNDIKIGHRYFIVEQINHNKQIKASLITVKYIKKYTDKSIQLCNAGDYRIIYNGCSNSRPFILCIERATTFYDFDLMPENLQELIQNYDNYENLLDGCIKYDL